MVVSLCVPFVFPVKQTRKTNTTKTPTYSATGHPHMAELDSLKLATRPGRVIFVTRRPGALLSFFGWEGSPTKIDYRKKLVPLFYPLYWRTWVYSEKHMSHNENSGR